MTFDDQHSTSCHMGLCDAVRPKSAGSRCEVGAVKSVPGFRSDWLVGELLAVSACIV